MSKLKPETEARGVAFCDDAKGVIMLQADRIRELEEALKLIEKLSTNPTVCDIAIKALKKG